MRAALDQFVARNPRVIKWGILLLALFHGLIFITIVPPWQHYDEPGNFEYAWLIANQAGIPAAGEYDQAMRRELAASMIEHNFFAGMGFRPNLVSQTKPIWIGISQTGDVPIYYWLIALPLRLLRTTDITFQLYVARMGSLLFYLVTIWAAFGIVSEITPKSSPLRWLVPLTLVGVPGFADLMTAVNNDVGATAFFSLFLLVCVRLIKRGFYWLGFFSSLLWAVLCIGTKLTVIFVIVLLPIAVFLSLFKAKNLKWAFITLLVLSIVNFPVIFAFNGARGWYLAAYSQDYRREMNPDTIFGRNVFRLDTAENTITKVYQPLETQQVEILRGQQATVGAWIWADQPVEGKPIIVDDGVAGQGEIVEVGVTPTFVSFPVTLDSNASFVNIIIQSIKDQDNPGNRLYVDGLVFVQGDYSEATSPEWGDDSGQVVYWADDQLTNHVRNPSFEQPWIRLRASLFASILGRWYTTASQAVTSLGDWASSAWYYRVTLTNLLQTFWGKFGWGHIPLLAGKLYWLMALVTALGLIGSIDRLWQRRKVVRWDILGILALAMVFGWLFAAGRGVTSLSGQVFIASSRYAYPVIIPTLLLLVSGWKALVDSMRRYVNLPRVTLYLLYAIGLFGLDLASWWSIIRYYNSLT